MVRTDEKSDREWDKRITAAGMQLAAVDAGRGAKALPGGELAEVRVLLATGNRTDVLLVIKARDGEKRYVAFIGGPDWVSAIMAWRARERGAGLQWKEDVWVGKPPKA